MDGHTPGETVDMNSVAVVCRRAWNAVDPRDRTEMKSPAQTVIVHHTALRFLISGDGVVYEGRGWGIVGAHAKEHNFHSVGIAFMGNFNDELPSSESLSALLRLLHIGVLHGHVRPNFVLVGHRDVAKTACPGEHLYSLLPKLREQLQNH
uniref:Peptidoglycan recognition protein 5 isoform A n=1 Tax=Ctenopharyngodon idella TaxID=7959 RepID=S4S7G5_CTEID|nr:peptidoglycan recognition protein 5 isoform A [Ctenopharyngodon idella]